MTGRLAVLVADDDALVRAAVGELIASDAQLELVGFAADAVGAVELAARLRPDVAVVDVKMPGGGAAAARGIHELSPQTHVVALSAYDDRAIVLDMLQAGVSSYVLKGARGEEILETIVGAARGDVRLSPAVAGSVVQELTLHLGEREERRAEEERIRAMLESRRFTPLFQPIVDLASRRVVGVEALTRFQAEPVRGTDDWFREAERVGLRAELELATAGAALARLDELAPDRYMALNFSPETLPLCLGLLSAERAPRIVVEVTEHAAVQDYVAFAAPIGELRARGVRVAVDDAGAGFASLRHTLHIEPDFIKLDVSLTEGIEDDPRRRALATGLVAFADGLASEIVAEGIETRGQLRALRELGVPFGQGYHLARPRPLEAQAAL